MPMRMPLTQMRIRRQSPNNTFGMVRRSRAGTPRPHQGWDLRAAVGTPVQAIAEGHVVQVHDEDSGDYGRSITLAFLHNGRRYFAFYAHLSAVEVRNRDTVHGGQTIGKTGKTGNASGLCAIDDHLHFEIRTEQHVGRGLGGRIDPGELLGYEVYSSQPE